MHQCEVCNYEIISYLGLKLHKETVHLGIVHKCLLCDHTTSQKSNLATHYRGRHKVPLVHKCDHCTMIFPNIHLTTVHKEKSLVKCPDCDYFSHRKKYMRTKHKARHVRERMLKILENKST